MRFEILEIIVRIAQHVYQKEIQMDKKMNAKSSNVSPRSSNRSKNYFNIAEAIEKLFMEFIDPAGFEIADSMEFRRKFLYNFRVNKYLEANESIFKRILSDYKNAGKNTISPSDAIYFVQNILGLFFIHERIIMRMYGYSKQSTIDLLKTPIGQIEMRFI